MSPSTRRAWIEMVNGNSSDDPRTVALHPEGVDRNARFSLHSPFPKVALHPEGVDRNRLLLTALMPSNRVALHPEGVDRNRPGAASFCNRRMSPSTRRAWIEMLMVESTPSLYQSPSTRRAWIEIGGRERITVCTRVALHPEGVDRNTIGVTATSCGCRSPSTRRAWIEIH